MVSILFIILVIIACFRPWIGFASYYLYAILGPQYIWWWAFGSLRISFSLAAVSIVGILLLRLKDHASINFLKNKMNIYLLMLWIFVVISYYFGPFASNSENNIASASLLTLTNTMMIMYFCATLAFTDIYKLKYLSYVFLLIICYMIFWCNEQYFLHNWDQFNFGRLMGPKSENGGSLYGDENGLSAIIVTGIPFIFFIGSDLKQKWLKYLLLSFIPFGMHAIFLTGSRGGLLGLLVTVVYILLKSKSKLLFILILPAVIGFYVWQGGDVMKERGESISEYKSESSAQNRLTAWEGGLKMIEAYPFTGVGLGSFVSVLPKFIDSPPLVAHNTLVQFTAESGIGAGVCYIAIIILFYANFRSIQNWCEKHADTLKNNLIKSLNNATACSFSGFITCSIFLSLNQFEVFYYLILINNSLLSLCTISNNNNGEIHE